MLKFRVTYIHKISQRCSCHHPQGMHFTYDKDMKWTPGPCTSSECSCKAFAHEYEVHFLPESLITDMVPPATTSVAKVLRKHKLLLSGQRLNDVRRQGDKLVCFPQASVWHSIIIEREPEHDEDCALNCPAHNAGEKCHTLHHCSTCHPEAV